MNEQGTVFLVDDEPAVVKALARLLRAEGYRTETFNSGQDFMDRYKPSGNGCLLLDLSMSGINGLDVQQWLADLGDPLPTIFLTAQDDFPQQIQTRMDQAAGVLTKPVSASVLVKAIAEALESR
jgi:FixJ family two-component response regulator